MNARQRSGLLLISTIKSGGLIAQRELCFSSVRGPGFRHPMLNGNTCIWGAALKQTLASGLAVGIAKFMFL